MYLDECIFSKLTFLSKDWSKKNTNLTVDQKQIYTGYRSVVATISEENDLERFDIHDEAIYSDTFIDHLEKLRKIHDK